MKQSPKLQPCIWGCVRVGGGWGGGGVLGSNMDVVGGGGGGQVSK